MRRVEKATNSPTPKGSVRGARRAERSGKVGKGRRWGSEAHGPGERSRRRWGVKGGKQGKKVLAMAGKLVVGCLGRRVPGED